MERYERLYEAKKDGYLTPYDGRYIIDTKHAIDRIQDARGFKERTPENVTQIRKVISDGIKKILTQYKDEATTYGIYSKSTGICAIIEWRVDYKDPSDKKNHAIVITIPPVKRYVHDFHVKQGDVRLVVENALHRVIMKQLQKEHRDLDRSHGMLDIVKFNEHHVTYHEGELWDSGIAYCIAVE